MRRRGARGEVLGRSSGRVDPLHNSVPERSPIGSQKPSTNVFTLGRARGGLSRRPTNESSRINSQGRITADVHGIDLPREQPNGSTPIRYSQRRRGIAATPSSLPSNRRVAPNASQTQNRVRRSLIMEGDNASSVMLNKEVVHDRRPQSAEIDQRAPSLSRSLSSPRQLASDRNAAGEPNDEGGLASLPKEVVHDRRRKSSEVNQRAPSHSRSLSSPRQLGSDRSADGQPNDEDGFSSRLISRSRCSSLPNNLGLDTRQNHCRHPSQGGSNSHDQSIQGDEVATKRHYNPRGATSLPELFQRKKYSDSKPVILLDDGKKFVGLRLRMFSLAIGIWVRQRENFPLTARFFKDVPEENVKRVVQLVRDHFQLVPDDALTEEMLREKLRITYNGYRSSLSAHYRLQCGNDYDKALVNPPENCTNMEDWTAMCNVLKTEEFQTKSEQASTARKSQVLKHSNGPTSFAQSIYTRALNGEPTDPITMFDVTHKFKKSTDPACETIKGKMKAMLEQVKSGELDMSVEDIYHANLPSLSSGRKRRRDKVSSVCYYSKTEEQLAEMRAKLDAANSERARQAKEIERLKKQSKNKGTKVMQYLNEVFVSLGREPLSEDALDEEEEAVEEEEEGVYENMDREDADEELVNGNMEDDEYMEEDQHFD